MTYTTLEYLVSHGVVTVRLNQPESLNAMTESMGMELLKAIRQARSEAKVLVIGSNGRAFSAGASVVEFASTLNDPQRDIGRVLECIFNPIVEELRRYPVPVITAVKGPAAGVGCSIALMGDIIVAGRSAYFLQAFRQVGLVPDGGAAYLLVKAIGRVRAMSLMLLAEKYTAERALADGLITRIADDDAVDTSADALAAELARGPTQSLSGIREAAWMALETPFSELLKWERDRQRVAGRTEDFAEGVQAFRERRAPLFKGR